jgi:gamma-glutamyltranspeptidase
MQLFHYISDAGCIARFPDFLITAHRATFVDPQTNKLYTEGTLIKNTKFCDTLQEISEHGSDFMYRGKLGQDLARDIQDLGGIVTEQDLANYK